MEMDWASGGGDVGGAEGEEPPDETHIHRGRVIKGYRR